MKSGASRDEQDFEKSRNAAAISSYEGEKNGRTVTVIIPHPARELPEGTFSSILRQSGFTHHEFDALL